MKRLLVLLSVFILLLSVQVLAVDSPTDILEKQKIGFGIEDAEQAIPEEAYALWGEVSVEQAMQPQNLLDQLWDDLILNTGSILRDAIENVTGILMLCFLIAFLRATPMLSTHQKTLELIGAMAIALLGAAQTSACIPTGSRVTASLTTFSARVLPAMCAAATASGAVTSAGIKYTIASIALDLFGSCSAQLLMPLLYAYTAVLITAHVFQNELLLTLLSGMKRVLTLLMITAAVLFTTFLTLTGILNGSVDAAAAKAAKTAISAALPVVGGILSDAAETLVSGASILCAGVGILGLLCVLAVCLTPYLSLGIHFLLYQLAAGICSTFSEKRISGLLKGFGDVYGMMLGIVGTVSLIVFASIIALMCSTGG